MRLFHRMKAKVLNKLSRAQYDQEATWSTRTWLALQTQRMSIAVHFATAYGSSTSLGRRTLRRSSAAGMRMRRHFEFGVARCSSALECTRVHWRAVACVPRPVLYAVLRRGAVV